MITIIYSTHKDKEYNDKFKTHLINSVGLDNVQILEYQNNNQYSLAQVYNSGITESIYDIVVCCHNDIRLEKGWGTKLLEDYKNFPEFGIIGQIWHHPPGQNKWINNYSVKLPFVVPVVTIDGLFISFDKNKIKHRFDETIGKFHFYDHCFCLPNYMDDVKIGVTSSFEIIHESIGKPNTEFYETKIKFLEKYKSILPLDLKPSFIYGTKEKVEYNKKLGKVAVVIPTKSNLDLLFQCINSFYEFSDSRFYDFFVADTGSSEEEKQEIRKFIQDKNIKFIEYNYYNFAKINNDVVTNHIGKDYQYVLFCNNDIKLMSDVVGGMLNVFKNKPRVGTVGCRLHYGDNTIQHDGILLYLKTSTNEIFTTHQNKLAYYKFTKDVSTCIGNTAGLMMININTFKQIGMFNEMYNECFEDVELNLNLCIRGLENYFLGTHCAYHFESKTREIEKSQTTMMDDYNGILIPFLQKNLQKLKNKIYFTN
jgi:GT2 family glycosyltransferase